MCNRTLVVGTDGNLLGVSWITWDGQEPCVICNLSDARGQSFSVKLDGESARFVSEALSGAADMIKDAEQIFAQEQARQASEELDRYVRFNREEA